MRVRAMGSARARFRGATPTTTPTRLAAVNPRRECVEEDASGTVDARGTTAADGVAVTRAMAALWRAAARFTMVAARWR